MAAITVRKWGNSLGICIPKEAAERIGIEAGSELELQVKDDEKTITLTTKNPKRRYSLEGLVSQITAENRHAEVDLGSAGRELL